MKNLTLKQRFIILNVLLVVIFLAIGIFTNYSLRKINHMNEVRDEVLQMDKLVLNLQNDQGNFIARDRNNPDFFKSGESAYITAFKNHMSEVEALCKKLSEDNVIHASSSDQVVDSISENLKAYESAFLALKDDIKEKGFKDWGLEGDLRTAIHEVEAIIKETNSDKLMVYMLLLRRHEKDFIIRKDLTYKEEFTADLNTMREILKLSDLTSRNKKEISDKLDLYENVFYKSVEMERKIGLTDKTGIMGELDAALLKMAPSVNRVSTDILNLSQQKINDSLVLLFIFLLVGAAIGVLLGIYISRNVFTLLGAEPVRVANIANDIAHGNLALEFDTNKNYKGVMNAFVSMANKLSDVVTNIVSGSANIASASQQLSSSSEQLSQGANEQASSIEEVSSSMEEMAANIQQNTENSVQAENISNLTTEGIQKVKDAAQESLESVRQISDKISIISDISFQTNLLALNAAVEAARAGEHGKGFAVVAAEVRRLAERSKVAAEEIVSLSQSSLKVTENAGDLMMNIIPEIEKTAKLVQEITAASQEQSNGASQVNNAIQQLNAVTQQNASTSEELASNAQELSAQAQQLKDIVSFFNIKAVNDNGVRKQSNRSVSPSAPKNNNANVKQDNSSTKGISLQMHDERDSEFEKF